MITFEQACELVALLPRPHFPAGLTFYVAPEGYEDQASYAVIAGAREFLVDGDPQAQLFDAPVYLVDKDTGSPLAVNVIEAVDRLAEMIPVTAGLTAAGVKTAVKKAVGLWDPSLHPRDKNGKFITKGSIVQLPNGQHGQVVGVTKGLGGKPKLTVETSSGTVTHPNAINVSVTKAAKPEYELEDKVVVSTPSGKKVPGTVASKGTDGSYFIKTKNSWDGGWLTPDHFEPKPPKATAAPDAVPDAPAATAPSVKVGDKVLVPTPMGTKVPGTVTVVGDDGTYHIDTTDPSQGGWFDGSKIEPDVTASDPAEIKAGDTVKLKGIPSTALPVQSVAEVNGKKYASVQMPNGNHVNVPMDSLEKADAPAAPTPTVAPALDENGLYTELPKVGDRVQTSSGLSRGVVTSVNDNGTIDVKWDAKQLNDGTTADGSTVTVDPLHLLKPEQSADALKPSYTASDGNKVTEGQHVWDKNGNEYLIEQINSNNAQVTELTGPKAGQTKTLPLSKLTHLTVTAAPKAADDGSKFKFGDAVMGNDGKTGVVSDVVGDDVWVDLPGGTTKTYHKTDLTKSAPDPQAPGTTLDATDSHGDALHVGDSVQMDDGSIGKITGDTGETYYVEVDGKKVYSDSITKFDGPDPAANPTWHDDVHVVDVAGLKIANGDTVYIPTIERKATVVGNLPPTDEGESPRLIVKDPDTGATHVVPAGNAEKVTDPTRLYGQVAEDSLPAVKITDLQNQALYDYTASGYTEINGALRAGKGALTEAADYGTSATEIKRLDALIKKSTLAQPILVYRGMHHTHPGVIKTGTVFRDWGFISSTTDRKIADGFGPGVLMQIELDPGQHALSIDNNGGGAQGGGEDEILLPRGQAFQATAVRHVNGRTIIKAKAVADPTGPVLASATMPETNPLAEVQEKSPMESYMERLIWDPADVEIVSQPEDDALTAAATARFAGDPEHYFGGDKRFPKGPHLGSWEALKKANPGATETVGHVRPDEVLFASQDHHDRQVAATYRAGEDGPHADVPAKVFHHTTTGRKHVINGHHRILADRTHGKITPVLYVGGGALPDSGGGAADDPAPVAAEASLDFGVAKVIKAIKAAWNAALHPRDKNGRFIPKGSNVTLKDGSTGKVTGAKALKNGGVALTVKRDNGTTAVVDAKTTTVQTKLPGNLGKMRVIHSNPRVPSADLMKSIKDNGGFTYDPKTGGLMVPGKDTGIAVAVPGTEQIVGNGEVSRHDFAKGVSKVLTAHRKEIAAGAKLGGWYSEDRNAYMVELTDVLPGDNRDAAIAEGKKRNQEGIFDIGSGEYIATGGTGDGKTTTPDAPSAPSAASPPKADEWTDHDPATWTPAQQAAFDTAGGVISKYAAIEPHVTTQLQHITAGLHARLEGLQYKLKTQKSLARKLDAKAPKKNTDLPPDQRLQAYADQVGDALRYTQLSDEDKVAANAKTTLDRLQQQGWTVSEVGNTWQPGNPYKGINTNLTSPDGQHTFELQFHTPQSLAVKEVNHKLYDVARLTTTPDAEKERLNAQMTANAEQIPQPPGIETVAMPTTPRANVDPLAAATPAPAPTPTSSPIAPGTKLDPQGLMDIAKAQPTPSASPVGKDFRDMTSSQKIAATAMMYGIGSKQYAQAVKKWGKKGVGGTVG